MSGLALIACLVLGAADLSTVGGVVVDRTGAPIAGARVFLEPGLGGALIEAPSDAGGRFQFTGITPGITGIFAFAPGHAFGGVSRNLAVGEDALNLRIVLGEPASIQGKVEDHRGKAIADASVTAVFIKDMRVGIPLYKLTAYGLRVPTSGRDGSVTVDQLPEGATVQLKINHGSFAQAVSEDLAVGSRRARIQMMPGILIRGEVRTRDQGQPVADAAVVIQRAQPPHDSAVVRSDGTGNFLARLAPGVYAYWSVSRNFRSRGKGELKVTGELPEQRLTVTVAGAGRIRGRVVEAGTNQPVTGARLLHTIDGNPSAYVRTGPNGTFELAAAEGDNYIGLETPAGYLAPPDPGYRVVLGEGQVEELPTFYVTPIPPYTVEVVDAAGQPVAGALITLLQPRQFGWHRTGADGRVAIDLASAPPDGAVVGMVEHVSEPTGALFVVRGRSRDPARVQLLPLATVRGVVTDPRGRPAAGVEVAGMVGYAEDASPIEAWRVVSQPDGSFVSGRAVPYAPFVCVAASAGEPGRSGSTQAQPGQTLDVGEIRVETAKTRPSLVGDTLDWATQPVLCGGLGSESEWRGRPAVVMYAPASRADIVVDAMTRAKAVLGHPKVLFAVVIDGPYACDDAAVPVLRGAAPGAASTYFVAYDGRVVYETAGLPAPADVRRLD